MATVTSFTALKIQQLMDEQIIEAAIVSNNLILTTRGGQEIDVGNVLGPQGPPGTDPSIVICTSTTRPTAGDLFQGLGIFETDTLRFMIYDGDSWEYRGGLWLCTSTTRPTTGLFNGREIYETDTKRTYIWDGDSWELTSSTIDPNVNNQLKKTAAGLLVDKNEADLNVIGVDGGAFGPFLDVDSLIKVQFGSSVRTTNGVGNIQIAFPVAYGESVGIILITQADLIDITPGDSSTCQVAVINSLTTLSGFWVRVEVDTNTPLLGALVRVNWLVLGGN